MRLGYIPDTPDSRDFHFDASPLRGASPIVSGDEIDLRGYLDAIQDQIANDCVGHSIAGSAFCTAAAAGEPIKRPSALFPYATGRLWPRRLWPKPVKLEDLGCSPRDAMLGIGAYGLVAEERWPEVEAFVNAVPTLDAFEAGDAAQITGFYRIPDGSGGATAAKLALRRGRFPMFGMVVDEAWEQLGSGIYARAAGKVLGGHMMFLIGYSPLLDAFRVVNSWGRGWGDDGFGWIAGSFFESSGVFDRWVIDVAPPEVS